MQSVSRISLGIADRLRDPAFRKRFFRGMAQDEIAVQIRQLRQRRGLLRQRDFGRRARMVQSAVSRIENAEYQGWTFKTLLRVADALDARLRISFEPVEDVIQKYRDAEQDDVSTALETAASVETIRGEWRAEVTEEASTADRLGTQWLSLVTTGHQEGILSGISTESGSIN